MGIILGGWLGYVMFYVFEFWVELSELVKLWYGGMSFYGGLIGIVLVIVWVSWCGKLNFICVVDYIVVCVLFGLLFGCFVNFVNGEFWGCVVGEGVCWVMIFFDGGLLLCYFS